MSNVVPHAGDVLLALDSAPSSPDLAERPPDYESIGDQIGQVEIDAKVSGDYGDTKEVVYSSLPAKFKKFHLNNKTSDSTYHVDGRIPGFIMIFNNETFHSSTGMRKRPGTDIDAKNLEEIFTKLGFIVESHKDKTSGEMIKITRDAATQFTYHGCDMFAMAILSHGGDGHVFGTDGPFETDVITNLFRGDSCPSLAGKPKLFIFQACRGSDHEIGVEPAVESDSYGGDQTDAGPISEYRTNDGRTIYVDTGCSQTLPSGSDFLFCYSVAKGFFSHRDTLHGSWYIQELTKAMNELIFNKDDDTDQPPADFLEVLTLVNKRVAGRSVERSYSYDAIGKKQMSCFVSMLTKKLYLLPRQLQKEK